MSELYLSDSLLLGSGHQRECYIHPEDGTKVIKVLKKTNKVENKRNQNLIEFIYYELIADMDIDYSHLPLCYGWVNTSRGVGLIFDRVMNHDGTDVISFYEAVSAGLLDGKKEIALLKELAAYLDANKLIFVDPVLTNLMLKRTSEDSYKLMITDGLGARKISLKYLLQNYLPYYKSYKIFKQKLKLFKDYRKIKHLTGQL